MMQLVKDLWFKRRDIVSDGYDESLDYLGNMLPLEIHSIPSGTECWTWTVPEKWSVREAFIENMDGKRLLDVKDHPLHVMSYSLPIDREVEAEELRSHLHSRPNRPDAIPFEFKYYQRDWGFCVEHRKISDFSKGRFRVKIDSSFDEGELKVGEVTVPGESDEVIVLMAHLCHPAMVDDDLTGCAVLAEMARELLSLTTKFTYKILFVPETIGSIAYLSQNEDLIPKIKYGIFLEMLGNANTLALQRSRQGNTLVDRVARMVLRKRTSEFREDAFLNIIVNDELVFNGPGVNAPSISISRAPYPEYHTSDDTPDIIDESRLVEAKEVTMETIRILEADYRPKRTFKGIVFLSRYDLWVDWRVDPSLNKNIDNIMMMLEGDMSIFEIAERLEMDFWVVENYIRKFREKGLVVDADEKG